MPVGAARRRDPAPPGLVDRLSPAPAPDGRASVRAMSRAGQPVLRDANVKIGLSTASVYPEGVEAAFEWAAEIGYDGVEVMVWTDPVSQDPYALKRLSDKYGVRDPRRPLAVPAASRSGCGRTDPWAKLQKAQFAAELLGAQTVVVHPPFRWQRDYARNFRRGIKRLADETDIRFAVENMFPMRLRGREVSAYQPTLGRRVRRHRLSATTPWTSRTPRSRSPTRWGCSTRWASGSRTSTSRTGRAWRRTSTWCPGRGTQPCAEVLENLAARGLPRPRRRRDQHPPRARPQRARRRPRRGARVLPAAPRRGCGAGPPSDDAAYAGAHAAAIDDPGCCAQRRGCARRSRPLR